MVEWPAVSSSGLPGISPTHLTVDRRAVPSRRLALMKRSTTAGACSWSRTARQDVCRFRRMAKGIRSSLGPMPGVVLLAPVAYVLPGHRCYIRPTEPPVAGHRAQSPAGWPVMTPLVLLTVGGAFIGSAGCSRDSFRFWPAGASPNQPRAPTDRRRAARLPGGFGRSWLLRDRAGRQ